MNQSCLAGVFRLALLFVLTFRGVLSAALAEKQSVVESGSSPSRLATSVGHHASAKSGIVHAISALQASSAVQLQSQRSSSKKASMKRTSLRTSSKRSRTQRSAKKSSSRLDRMLRKQRGMTRMQKQAQKTALCGGMKLKWWIKIKKKCQKSFGQDSKWDQNRLKGECGDAWDQCHTAFYAVCCTQPTGPKSLSAYCAKAGMTAQGAGPAAAPPAGGAPSAAQPGGDKDKACQVQGGIKDINNLVGQIKGTVSGMQDTEPTALALSLAPGPASYPAPAPAMAPPGIMGAGPAPAPTPFGPTAVLESKCDRLMFLTKQAADRIKSIKAWAAQDGLQDANKAEPVAEEAEKTVEGKDMEANDPDLAITVKGILKMGDKLDEMLKKAQFCNQEPEDDDDDDETEGDLAKEPDAIFEDADAADEAEGPEINETGIMALLDWSDNLKGAVNDFETKVHPHGYKWWRYRYEYTIVESFVLAFSVMVLYLTMWLLHGVSFFNVHKFYRTGLLHRLYRYAYVYFVFHAAALMIMVCLGYMLYVPWGKKNIFNWFAEATHDFIDGEINVPYLGYSWLFMVLDIQFQLFVTFAIYAVFLCIIVQHFTKSLQDWKDMDDDSGDVPTNIRSMNNVALYRALDEIIVRKVRNNMAFQQYFSDYQLRLKGVDGLGAVYEFKLHVYLTEALGKSIEYLVEVSLMTNIWLAISTLVVALLAHIYQLAFMYFLPFFVGLAFLVFAISYGLARSFRSILKEDESDTGTKVLSIHGYCRTIQIVLYCVFYSFARLLLSNDIWEYYPSIYVGALIGLGVVMGLLFLFAGEVVKETTCALSMPPHISPNQFRRNLEQVAKWQKVPYCHESGVDTLPMHAAFSAEWAGRGSGVQAGSGRSQQTPRPYSFR